MPRKPTPSILETPAIEETPAAVEVEIPVPEPVVAAVESAEEVAAEVGEKVEAAGEKVEEVPAAVEQLFEEVTVETPVSAEEAPAEEDTVIAFKLPIPSPLYKPLHTMLLASLGVASYAVEESKFVITKLVERGELTEKEGMKLLTVVAKRVKRKPKADQAEEVPAPEDEVKVETVDATQPEAETPAEPEIVEVEDEDDPNARPRNIYTVNIFSPGSNVFTTPRKKPTK
jgi:polyhydroxyalkanoate synthesis regulator phasin